MQIYPTSETTFNGLVPASKYKGVVLKLTNEDKEKISKLLSEKSELLIQLTSVEKKLDKHKTIIGSAGLSNIYMKIDARIKEINDTIRQIKIDRKNQQIEEMKNLDLVV